MKTSSSTQWLIFGVLTVLGLAELARGLTDACLWPLSSDALLAVVGWGPFAELFVAISTGAATPAWLVPQCEDGSGALFRGAALWAAGWAWLAVVWRSSPPAFETQPELVGAPLHPRLGRFIDIHWGTLTAYGFGIFLSELVFILLYTALVGKGVVQGGELQKGLTPATAFLVAVVAALSVAFAGGVVGASHSKRLSTPEVTLALLYFGLPIPIFLSALNSSTALLVQWGPAFREVMYLASLLGRPELGYWLLTLLLMLGFFFGVNFGFVATSSGRLDLRVSYELFVASRHVSVFRPQLLGGVFAVLILGIIPPLLLWAIIQAAEKVVERTRIRLLGLNSPLAAAEALHQLKLKARTPTAMMTGLSVGGVGVGVMALIIVMSVMSGFEADLREKILGTNAHGVVSKYASDMPEYESVMKKVAVVPGIVGVTPFVISEVMLSTEGSTAGAVIKGIEPDTVGQVTDLQKNLTKGSKLEWLKEPSLIPGRKTRFPDGAFDERPASEKNAKVPDIAKDPLLELPPEEETVQAVLPGIVLGRELAASLRVDVGDRLNVISPLGGELGPQGPMPKSRPFRVAGIVYSGMYEYDSKFVYILLSEAARFFNVQGATGVEVKVDEVDDARAIMKAVYDTLDGYPFRTKDWGEMNRNLFSALRLEKLVMGIILSIIVIVAAGLIVATIIMLVLEKRKEIAVLKALGVPDGGIVKIFLTEGLQIGVAGGVLGLVSGLAWCVFIERVGIKLDPQVYYIPALPVRIEPLQTALSVVVAILVTFLASIYPALKAAQVEPVEGLKAE